MTKFALIITILLFCACDNKTKEVITVKEASKTIIELPANNTKDSIEGVYTAVVDSNNDDECKLILELIKTKGGYSFSVKTNKRNIQGKAKLVSNGPDEKYILLEDIPWDEYEGNISNEDTVESKDVEIPIGIDFLYRKDTLTIQNYGNSMNYYTKFGECGSKYIQLVKK